MSIRAVYVVGLLGIILLGGGFALLLAIAGHSSLASDALQGGIMGAFLWGFLKETGSLEPDLSYPEESEASEEQ